MKKCHKLASPWVKSQNLFNSRQLLYRKAPISFKVAELLLVCRNNAQMTLYQDFYNADLIFSELC